MKKRGPQKQKDVETSFGKPVIEVARDLADAGLSADAAADQVGYNREAFRDLLRKSGLADLFPRKRRDIIALVEEEYGQDFWSVVKGYADDGESMTATGLILGYSSPSGFRRLINRHGKRHWFPDPQDTNGMKASKMSGRMTKPTPARQAALERANDANPIYRRITLNGITDTITGHSRRVGISVHTVRKRLNRGMSHKDAFSKINYTRLPADNSQHPWRISDARSAAVSAAKRAEQGTAP